MFLNIFFLYLESNWIDRPLLSGILHTKRPRHLPNGHCKCAALNNETRVARFPSPALPPVGEGDKVSLREFHVKPVDYVPGCDMQVMPSFCLIG
jgi:hypothetical protein